MTFRNKPDDFNKRFDIVGCFIECDGKFLLLRRHSHKANGDTWGLPAGKAEEGEDLKQAVLREIAEETGMQIPDASVAHFDSLYIRDGSFDIEWHMYSTSMDTLPEVTIDPYEHAEFRWASPEEALQMPLIHDLAESVELFYRKDL